uniref:PRA1 family protein n=2 Tax=Aegilops tauschii subsp. strangulata TaxID=200361 RepID=A0A453PY35_AEGTS
SLGGAHRIVCACAFISGFTIVQFCIFPPAHSGRLGLRPGPDPGPHGAALLARQGGRARHAVPGAGPGAHRRAPPLGGGLPLPRLLQAAQRRRGRLPDAPQHGLLPRQLRARRPRRRRRLALLWHPGTLFALLALCAAWFFLYFSRRAEGAQPLRVFGTEFDDGTVLALLSGVTVIAMLFTDVGWNVVGSVMIGLALAGAHAALRSTDDLFLTEQEAAGNGLVAAGFSAAGPILPTYVRIG